MATLATDLRNQLARAIQNARREAEAGARKALESLAVHLAKSHDSMDGSDRALRGRLRAHGKQLGDTRHPTRDTQERGAQEIVRLAHETAYEHWHRMLFARFLAENQLLIESESGVAISMAECEELARENGEDSWALAGRFAQRMLPRIFRPDDPALEVILPPETRQALERELASLPPEVFRADDSLGWTYQFWQADRKDEVNRSGGKIGADELPAVTQLFTEHYMVLFLFHNTIGAWRAGKILAERPDLAEADNEDALRRVVRLGALGGYDFTYLRFVRERRDGDEEGKSSGPWRPAAGRFGGWPARASELRVLDPCCGSGHFLVEGLDLLVRLRMEEEGLSVEESIRAVLTENLFGLEIDPRCTQIAAFNLALAAWKLAGKPIDLPPLNISCAGLSVGGTRDEWLALLDNGAESSLRFAFGQLYDLFRKAASLGSLIDPGRFQGGAMLDRKGTEALLAALSSAVAGTPERYEMGVAAQGIAHATELLRNRYTLVITNVPYLGRGKQDDVLKQHVEDQFALGKADLATAFVQRALDFCALGGTTALVTPQNWLFLTSYKKLREKLLTLRTWNLVARLGPGAFETIGGHVVNVALNVISALKPERDELMAGLDASGARIPAEKAALLRGEEVNPRGIGASSYAEPQTADAPEERSADAEDNEAAGDVAVLADGSVRLISQTEQVENPDARIALSPRTGATLLASRAHGVHGLGSKDTPCFFRQFWEIPNLGSDWEFLQTTVDETCWFGGMEQVVLWEKGKGVLHDRGSRGEAVLAGRIAWAKSGVLVGQMGQLACCLYVGDIFDKNAAVILPHDASVIPAMWCFCSSPEFAKAVRRIDQALKVTNASLVKVPFDLSRWQQVADEKYPDGLPEPQSDDPTQWLFHGRPEQSNHPLQAAVARLLGYRWPAELDAEMRLSERARELVRRCDDLLDFADHDGVVCVPSVRGEKPAADRLLSLLSACGIRPDRDLDEWLRTSFFEEHCKLFHHRPFVWHIWDGREDGFHALVNYHRLAASNGEGRRTLEALTYSYLGDWIERQKAEQREGRAGADARLAAAQDLQAQLADILAGEPPCDFFIRWKPLHEQPIGWDPDINDGVRLNIRPFMSAALRKGGRSGAGILRWKPNISWKKDRGTEPESLRPKDDFPWFWRCPGDSLVTERTDFMGGSAFDGSRWNDLHYTNEKKNAAREQAKTEATRA